MKKYLLSILVSLALASSLYANESSEDTYTLDEACELSHGIHMGQILSLESDSRFRDIITDREYSIGSFQNLHDRDWGDSVFFVVNDNGIPGVQSYSELFLVNCDPQSGQTVHFSIHRAEPKIQYSPEITKITSRFILLDDWQRISGKSYHVVTIFDRQTSTFTQVRDEVLKKNSQIKRFVKNKQFFWNVLSYSSGVAKVEVRLSPEIKKTFLIRL